MNLAVVVHGRFHAFDLARSLIARGHDVTLLTNYPRWAVARFGVAPSRVRSFWVHGVMSRAAWRLHQRFGLAYPEPWLHTLFGRWSARQLRGPSWDAIHLWSGVAEETLTDPGVRGGLKLMMRGSAHIRVQARLLREEAERTHTRQDMPSPWIIRREEREYALATRIVTLSTFARRSFLAEGFASDRLELLPLAASANTFRPTAEVVEARCRRILSGEPLHVLFVGTLSYRKGLWDMRKVVEAMSPGNFRFRLVGPETPEVRGIVQELRPLAEFIPNQPQAALPDWYAEGDLFVFPTIEDGFAQVLAQAGASALPILTTTNSGGPDFIREGETGWILPIRSASSFIERLHWCDAHRPELAAMVRQIYDGYLARDWPDVARDFEQICNGHSGQGSVS